MNAKTGKRIALAALAGAIALLSLQQPAFAEGKCKEVRAQLVEVSTNPATSTGTITQGGTLNGTTLTVFGSGALPTSDPTTVSFAGDFTITTNQGQLKASNVYLYNFAGVSAVLGRINSTTSTGRFAGAMGVLYFAAKVTSFSPFTVQSEITAEICFAHEGTEGDDHN